MDRFNYLSTSEFWIWVHCAAFVCSLLCLVGKKLWEKEKKLQIHTLVLLLRSLNEFLFPLFYFFPLIFLEIKRSNLKFRGMQCNLLLVSLLYYYQEVEFLVVAIWKYCVLSLCTVTEK